MAKQVIAEHRRVLLPPWTGGEGMPNPPVERDASGRSHQGDPVDVPARMATLLDVRLEVSMGDYTPDIECRDQQGDLLVEIRYSHAVDDRKALRVRSEGRRMLEINLSKLTMSDLVDEQAFARAVLDCEDNRHWISLPEAADAWRESRRRLQTRLVEINAEERRRRAGMARDLQRLQEEQRSKLARLRLEQHARRAPYRLDLAALAKTMRSTDADRIARYEQFKVRDGRAAEWVLRRLDPEHRRIASTVDASAPWPFNALPELCLARAIEHFVDERDPGFRFTTSQMLKWFCASPGVDLHLWRLFQAQEESRREAVRWGNRIGAPWAWFFTDAENSAIPNLWDPINRLVDQLVAVGSVRRHVTDRWRLSVATPEWRASINDATMQSGRSVGSDDDARELSKSQRPVDDCLRGPGPVGAARGVGSLGRRDEARLPVSVLSLLRPG